jgi:hypothetical protein
MSKIRTSLSVVAVLGAVNLASATRPVAAAPTHSNATAVVVTTGASGFGFGFGAATSALQVAAAGGGLAGPLAVSLAQQAWYAFGGPIKPLRSVPETALNQ